MPLPQNTWRPAAGIRAVAIGVARQESALLVAAVHRDDGSIKGWRPFGGGIEVGERSDETVIRELREELGAEVEVGQRLGVLESIYTHYGAVGHEIVFVHEVHVRSPGLASAESFTFREDSGQALHGEWRALAA